MIVSIWLVFGLISSIVAVNKGRSGCGWLTLGVLLGPFGFALALIAGPNKAALEEHALRSGDKKMCPYCAELIPADAVKCGFCGAEL